MLILVLGNVDVTLRCPIASCRCAKQTALHVAALYGHYEAAEALLHCGCDVMALDSNGKTAAKLAESKGYEDIAKLLSLFEKIRS